MCHFKIILSMSCLFLTRDWVSDGKSFLISFVAYLLSCFVTLFCFVYYLLFGITFANRQYNPSKPNKWHLKYFAVTDANQFTVKFLPYDPLKPKEKNKVTYNIVKELMEAVPEGKFYIFFMDSYYGDLEIVRLANKLGFGVVANCKATRPSFLFRDGLHNVLILLFLLLV